MKRELKDVFDREINTNKVGKGIPLFLKDMLTDQLIYDFLYAQFEMSSLVPDFYNYLDINKAKHKIDELYEDHLEIESNKPRDGVVRFMSSTEYESTINNMYNQFLKEIGLNTLDRRCYINDLHATPLMIVSKELEIVFNDFRKHLFSELNDDINQCIVFASTIYTKICEIENNYIKGVFFKYFLNDNENIFILIEGAVNRNYKSDKDDNRWRSLKRNFDFELNKLIMENSLNNDDNYQHSKYSVSEWALIAYFAITDCNFRNELKHLTRKRTAFLETHKEHGLSTTENSFNTNYSEMKNSLYIINKKQNHTVIIARNNIERLNKILPFISEYYSDAIQSVNYAIDEENYFIDNQ